MSPPSAPPSAMGPPPPKQSDRRATLNPSQMQDWKPRGAGDSFSLNSAPAPPPSTLHDAASDPWGAGTTWERDSPAGKAQTQRRRQTSFVPGTGAMGNKSAAGGYGAPPPVGDRRASNGAADEFHSVPSSPWGSPAKNGAPGGYYHGQNAAPAPSPRRPRHRPPALTSTGPISPRRPSHPSRNTATRTYVVTHPRGHGTIRKIRGRRVGTATTRGTLRGTTGTSPAPGAATGTDPTGPSSRRHPRPRPRTPSQRRTGAGTTPRGMR